MNFDTTLLREKFLISEENVQKEPLRVVSNRLSLLLNSREDNQIETFVVRAQTMHVCIRLAAQIMQSYQKHKLGVLRNEDFDWEDCWRKSINPHDKKYNESLWGAVYMSGKRVFHSGDVHAFLDMIEKCDTNSKAEYDESIPLAEKAFEKSGKSVSIEHESNMGLVVNTTAESGRCGIILRNALESATFSFSVNKQNGDDAMNIAPSSCLHTCAAFLEAIQLSFTNGMGKAGIGNIKNTEMASANKRITELNREINQFEKFYDVSYRPDKPDFIEITKGSEVYFRSLT